MRETSSRSRSKGSACWSRGGNTGRVSRYELNRHWAQVVVHREGVTGRVSLGLRSHGKEVEFGTHLTEEQREAAVRALTQQLRNHRYP